MFWAQYTVRVNNRNDVQAKLKDNGIFKLQFIIQYPFTYKNAFKYLNYKKDDFPISEQASKEAMSLPMNPFLTNKEIDHICNYLKSEIKEKKG